MKTTHIDNGFRPASKTLERISQAALVLFILIVHSILGVLCVSAAIRGMQTFGVPTILSCMLFLLGCGIERQLRQPATGRSWRAGCVVIHVTGWCAIVSATVVALAERGML